jgi:hypothetical protein
MVKTISIVIMVIPVILGGACSMNNLKEKQASNEVVYTSPPIIVPDELNDEWTRWIIGTWGDFREPGSQETRIGWMKAELGLNGQFLILRHEFQITDEDIDSLKERTNTTDDQADKFQSQTHKEIEYYTIDPETQEVIGYLFDGLRCIAVGRGKREGNKEVITWKWKCGRREATSIRTTVKVSEDKLLMTDKYLATDGTTMIEGTAEAIRKK